MSIRPILLHPDPRLRKKAEPVDQVDLSVKSLIEDMLATMYDAPGVGLAAPQIGVLSRVFVMDAAGKDEAPAPKVFINPQITWKSAEMNTHQEGCLSIPEQFDDVTRPASVTLAYLDGDGSACEETFEGLAATCVQHEIDHLDGKLFIDYLGPVKRQMITAKMKKLKRERAKEKAETKNA
ncbi:MAG: peptide deformylase [Neomegalonema sp.]|nr:peptide deformylase [Neomegalonema sp.]